jgi:hypothetical protein
VCDSARRQRLAWCSSVLTAHKKTSNPFDVPPYCSGLEEFFVDRTRSLHGAPLILGTAEEFTELVPFSCPFLSISTPSESLKAMTALPRKM